MIDAECGASPMIVWVPGGGWTLIDPPLQAQYDVVQEWSRRAYHAALDYLEGYASGEETIPRIARAGAKLAAFDFPDVNTYRTRLNAFVSALESSDAQAATSAGGDFVREYSALRGEYRPPE